VDYKHVRFGETRTETIAHLGLPKMSEQKGDLQVDYFEFMDGYHPASKARILLYVQETCSLPASLKSSGGQWKMAVFDGKLCRATVKYGPDGLVKSYELLGQEGQAVVGRSVAAASDNR